MSGNKSIRDFFKPSQPAQPSMKASVQPSTFKVPTSRSSNSPKPSVSDSQLSLLSNRPKSGDQRGYTSSLSPTPGESLSSPSFSPLKENVPLAPSRQLPSEILNSDDEGGDSDSSLEDLLTAFTSKSSENKTKDTNGQGPSTPIQSKNQNSSYNIYSSPLAVLPKYQFDLNKLVSHAEIDEATEASSKRFKAMLAARDEGSEVVANNRVLSPGKFSHGQLLESVVAQREDGEVHKVKRALLRTEATVTEERWYFFDTQSASVTPERKSFPTASVTSEWKRELGDPKMRYQTFISGFAEDMVTLGKNLPDEIFLWILDELCSESSDPLRASYTNVVRESTEQIRRLVMPDVTQRMFRRLGGTSSATTVTEKVRLVKRLADPYSSRDWPTLLSVINLFSLIARRLQQEARMHVVCILLRLSVDQLVLENVDLLDSVQEALHRLCRYTADDEWESFCKYICKVLFTSIDLATLRLQIVDCISSTTPRTHDLRRRLAMCFFFDELSYSEEHSHILMDLDKFMDRLEDSTFDTNAQTDYRELAALISLLDVAVDDGRSMKLDLADKKVEQKFNRDVDEFCGMIKVILKHIGRTGAAFISRIEAKESLELVARRIADQVRSKPKPRETWFDKVRGRKEEDLEAEKKGMASFVMKVNGNGIGINEKIAH